MEYPVLDAELADQLFTAANEADITDLRAMVAEFVADLAPRFAALHRQCAASAAEGVEAQRGLHGLRGVAANFALARTAEQLRVLEKGWSGFSPAERSALLGGAEASLQTGLRALRERFAYLG